MPLDLKAQRGRLAMVAGVLATASLQLTPRWAIALQLVDARDGVSAEALVSIKEPTRIRVDGTPITDVFGSIYSSTCGTGATSTSATPGVPSTGPLGMPVNPGGELALECDRDKGEIYIRPVGSSDKPINLFISTPHATYTLLLHRSDTPADTIVIRDSSVRQTNSGTTGHGPSGTSPNHIRAMKALLVAMASDRVPPELRVEEIDKLVPLWAEVRFSLMRRYAGRGLIGEKYLLQNTSQALMVLAEQEFDREDGQVIGVAIESHNLRPGDTTNVFVIRQERAR